MALMEWKHVPTLPTASTATNSTFDEQQEALYVAMVMLMPPSPREVVVSRLPFPKRTVTLWIPVPFPSVRFAESSHLDWLQFIVQLLLTLTTWHTGRLKSVTFRKQEQLLMSATSTLQLPIFFNSYSIFQNASE